MKTLVTALAVAVGLSLGAAAAAAAPVSMPGATLNVGSLLQPAQYYGGYGYRYRPYCYRVRRCDYYGRCWYERVCR